MNPIVNVLDLEMNYDLNIIEIGLTMVNLKALQIIKTISIPIWPQINPLSQEIIDLTGWTDRKLKKSGIPIEKACERLINKYGGLNRILVIDQSDELKPFDNLNPFQGQQINVSDLFRIATNTVDTDLSLDKMLQIFNLKFEGQRHRGSDDSKNIARLFIHLMQNLRKNLNVEF